MCPFIIWPAPQVDFCAIFKLECVGDQRQMSLVSISGLWYKWLIFLVASVPRLVHYFVPDVSGRRPR